MGDLPRGRALHARGSRSGELLPCSGEGLHRYVDPRTARSTSTPSLNPTTPTGRGLHRPARRQARMDLPRIAPGSGWSPPRRGRSLASRFRGRCATTSAPRDPSRATLRRSSPAPGPSLTAGPGAVARATETCAARPAAAVSAHARRYLDSDDVFEVTRAGLDFSTSATALPSRGAPTTRSTCPSTTWGHGEPRVHHLQRELHFALRHPRSRNGNAAPTRRSTRCATCGSVTWRPPPGGDDLWLKESFAENQGASAIATATRYAGEWANFAMNRKIWAYAQDQMPTTPHRGGHPRCRRSKTNFDGITYAKGAAVLKQLVAWVGEDPSTKERVATSPAPPSLARRAS